ncbi:MAG: multidrug ABC transporter [Candidatus Kerfeldbacteria bacterium CG15_BIG_FIL_POST_REV_8_21_14_020_45_12]|uniref:Multidrug ABC transporter n=1 Tax=Candidatus Kerfeldbacteria bacterium CG15_BIG_FIL_POST_REV_8_21_14_020_45_12 TaxID=2014247 RepID=A0A2M7H3I9_9BACT|nr:MAG: multidrug ABC transporter [Candidatus Kerfeldbacteria bacterium CG15_BIG_FIL_POST_REV_8_21_14_020_45_12]PJA93080.1 MAG: multidrug ABC transporter [Candidatus Kerfeldbacteria bacterium CG_4_9_14_3_um_filter_45_8]
MNEYTLNTNEEPKRKGSILSAVRRLKPLLVSETVQIILAALAIVINSTLTLLGPVIIGHVIDTYIATRDFNGVLLYTGILTAMYCVGFVASYAQTRIMGGVSLRVLYRLRNSIFEKLQDLPVAFFQQNKAGDLISRINNDTDKLGQFFSQSIMQFIGNIFIIIGSAIAILLINFKLGLAALVPAALLLFLSKVLGPWIKRKNAINMKSVGGMSAEIQESLDHFKVVVAFDRRDYFRKSFQRTNEDNYHSAVRAGIANNTFTPVYGFASNLALLIVILYGFNLISASTFTFGLLISFLSYIYRLYDPLRQMAALWTTFQVALAGWDRIHAILQMNSNITILTDTEGVSRLHDKSHPEAVMEFSNVSFTYATDVTVLDKTNFVLDRGKTYALVGPTGGGKTTTASLMARLYDPVEGMVLLNGRDLRTFSAEERAENIGFILQEPFLFSGTVGDNIRYGNPKFATVDNTKLTEVLEQKDLQVVINKFDKGLDTIIENGGDSMSLGQKQLIAFMRALMRAPKLLILDEATANIDTVTEQLLEDILRKLPPETTKVIIAHRLNTIADADTIFFVNSGSIIEAGSMQKAVDLLMHGKRKS